MDTVEQGGGHKEHDPVFECDPTKRVTTRETTVDRTKSERRDYHNTLVEGTSLVIIDSQGRGEGKREVCIYVYTCVDRLLQITRCTYIYVYIILKVLLTKLKNFI